MVLFLICVVLAYMAWMITDLVRFEIRERRAERAFAAAMSRRTPAEDAAGRVS